MPTMAGNSNFSLKTITDAESKVTSYGYDPRDLKVEETYPDHVGGSTPGQSGYGKVKYRYDALGRQVRREDQKGEAVKYVFDLAGRLTGRQYPDTNNDSFTYDDDSRLLTAVSARYGNTVTRTYDDAGRQTADNLTIGADHLDGGVRLRRWRPQHHDHVPRRQRGHPQLHRPQPALAGAVPPQRGQRRRRGQPHL